jgi:hypothetical protein
MARKARSSMDLVLFLAFQHYPQRRQRRLVVQLMLECLDAAAAAAADYARGGGDELAKVRFLLRWLVSVSVLPVPERRGVVVEPGEGVASWVMLIGFGRVARDSGMEGRRG